MKRDEFIKTVQKKLELDSKDDAIWITDTILKTLSERLTEQEAFDLASQLPRELKELVKGVPDHVIKMDRQKFIAKVAERLDVSLEEAERYIKATFSVLKSAVTPGEIEDVLSQLPKDLAGLLAEA